MSSIPDFLTSNQTNLLTRVKDCTSTNVEEASKRSAVVVES